MSLTPDHFDGDTARRLRDFEATPPDNAWASVVRARKKPTRRPAWYRASALSGLALLVVTGWWVLAGGPLDAIDEATRQGSSGLTQSEVEEGSNINASTFAASDDTEGGDAARENVKSAGLQIVTSDPAAVTTEASPWMPVRSVRLSAKPAAAASPEAGVSTQRTKAPLPPANAIEELDQRAARRLSTGTSASVPPQAALSPMGGREERASTTAALPRPDRTSPLTALPWPSVEEVQLAKRGGTMRTPPPPRPSAAAWSRQVRLSAGLAATQRAFQAHGDDDSAYARRRDTLESNRPDLVGALVYEQTHHRGLRLRAGIGYQAYHRESAFTSAIIEEATTRTVLDPSSGAVVRTDTLARAYRVRNVTQNRQQTATVSLGAGYAIPTGGAWRPYVVAEAGYEFLLATRGKLQDRAGDEVSLDNAGSEWINPRPGLRLGGTAGLDIAIAPKWLLGVQASFYKVGDPTGADDPLSAKMQVLSGGLSLSVKL